MPGFLEAINQPECVVAPSSKNCAPDEYWNNTDNNC
jgi:hypothetical protein